MSQNGNKNGVIEINPFNLDQVETISDMHLHLLSWGPLARLGKMFLVKVCYTILIKDNLMKAAIFYYDHKPAGFIAYTPYSISFHQTAIKKHWLYVVYILILSIIRDPRLVVHIAKAIHLMISRSSEKEIAKDPSAEILAIGVNEEYRSPHFIQKTGIRISQELLKYAVNEFKKFGLKEMRVVVDVFNKAAIFLYLSLDGRAESFERHGDKMYQIWLNFDSLS
jgi:ribosomal protein S18 acetylase RimI-like enzyme